MGFGAACHASSWRRSMDRVLALPHGSRCGFGGCLGCNICMDATKCGAIFGFHQSQGCSSQEAKKAQDEFGGFDQVFVEIALHSQLGRPGDFLWHVHQFGRSELEGQDQVGISESQRLFGVHGELFIVHGECYINHDVDWSVHLSTIRVEICCSRDANGTCV
jgi:hypothetical protein